jgi:hypothetical protein
LEQLLEAKAAEATHRSPPWFLHSPIPFRNKMKKMNETKGIHPFPQKQCQARLYHATNRNEIILPLCPK